MKKSLLTALTLWLSFHAIAQNFSMLPLPTQRLLPVASIHCLMQDSEGFFWYGTESGLCRDNGYQIDVFRPSVTKRPQDAYRVNCIVENAKGNIFFGTADGLFYIDKKDYCVRCVELDSTKHFIEALYVDSHHHLWVGTQGVIFEYEDDGRVIKDYPCRLSDQPASVASIFEDSHGTLFVLQWRSGILRKQKGDSTFASMEWPLPRTPLQMTEDIQHHCYWVLTSGAGIQRMTIEGNVCQLTPQPATMGDDTRNRALYMIRDDRHGLFWTTTQDDLYAYRYKGDGLLQEFPLAEWYPNGKKILDQMCLDKNDNIYVAGYTPHTFIITSPMVDIQRLPVDAIRRQTGYPLLADRAVYDGSNYIWIWQGRQGLMLYNREKDSVEPVPFRCGRTIQRSSLGGIWCSDGYSVFHLWQIDGKVQREETVQTPEGTHISCLYEKDGESLYIVADNTLYRLTLPGRQFLEVATLPDIPNDIAVARDGSIYLALGNGGLCQVFSKGKVQRMDTTHETYLSVCTMADGSVWASTLEGNVWHYSPTSGKLSKQPLLCSDHQAPIKSIRVDGLGHVWTMTDQEVCEYAPQTHAFRTFRNTDTSIDVSYFYGIEPIDPSRICINGAGALIEVQSSAELNTQESAQVPILLSSIRVNGEKRIVANDKKTISLVADEEDVILYLTTLDHLHASSIRFAYQFEGSQDDWHYLSQGTNSITYSNLSKGDHPLYVMATNHYGLWSKPIHLVTIHRAAHWWETWWAYLLYIGLALILIYGIWRLEHRIHLLQRLILRRQEVHLDEIEMTRDDIADQQRDDEFLRKVILQIETNLSRTDYNVETLSDDMCMSRITLYRRLQEQTGLSPTDFIRDIRLKKAAQLLIQHPDATLVDISRKVGFATPKYFSRCFKEKFGVLPKEYCSAAKGSE